MNITEVRLRQIVIEEVQLRLLRHYVEIFKEELAKDNIEPTEEQLNEAIPRWAKALGLTAALGAGVMPAQDFAGKYQQQVDKTHQRAEKVRTATKQAKERVGLASSFLEDANAPPIKNQAQVDNIVDGILSQFGNSIEATNEVRPGRGLPQEAFYIIPPESLPDDYVLPFVGMKKVDYEQFIDGWDTRHLRDMAKGGKPGSSVYWGYGYEAESPVFSFISPDAPPGQRGMLMPPEYSLVLDLYKQRTQVDQGVK